MCGYPLRAEKPGLHPNLMCVHGDRGCRNPIPGDVAGKPGICLEYAQGQNSFKGLPRATHCTDRAQNSGIVTSTVELCPPHPTFQTKVRARRDMPEEKKKIEKYTYTYCERITTQSGSWLSPRAADQHRQRVSAQRRSPRHQVGSCEDRASNCFEKEVKLFLAGHNVLLTGIQVV